MYLLVKMCPQCKGNLQILQEERALQCEDCGYREETKSLLDIRNALEEAEEWGSKENRYTPTPFGRMLIENRGLVGYLRETLIEATKGLELEDHDLNLLKKWGLIENG